MSRHNEDVTQQPYREPGERPEYVQPEPSALSIAFERLERINRLTADMVRLEKEVEDRDERRRFEMFQMKVMIYGVLILVAFAFWHFVFGRAHEARGLRAADGGQLETART